jgi:TonB family protein
MYFDFGDGHPDLERLPRALSTREEVLVAIIVHLLVVIALLVVPRLPFVKARALAAEQARQAALLAQQQRRQEQQPFMFVQPRLDVPAPKPPSKAPPSDMNRQAMTAQRPPDPKNSQPFMRGNTTEFSEASRPSPPPGAQVQGPPTPPAPPAPPGQDLGQNARDTNALRLPDMGTQPAYPRENTGGGRPQATGPLGAALQDLQRYANQAALENPQGGNGNFGPAIQFDTKGVEFGPWVRRFLAQLKRNWMPLIPQAAMSLRGHVSISFNVHKDGALTDVTMVAPCPIDGFNSAAFNALLMTNPTQPLPPEYPSPVAAITVTFFYNEYPPSAISP